MYSKSFLVKNALFLSLLTFGSVSHPISPKGVLWALVRPFKSMDAVAEETLQVLHKKNDGLYVVPDDKYANDGGLGTAREMRAQFPVPENDSTSVDRLAKAMILARTHRLEQVIAQRASLEESGDRSYVADYTAIWKEQSIIERFLWTTGVRRPYTYFASLSKWVLEAYAIGGCAYGIYKFKNWYQNKNKQNQVKVADASGVL